MISKWFLSVFLGAFGFVNFALAFGRLFCMGDSFLTGWFTWLGVLMILAALQMMFDLFYKKGRTGR